MKKNRNKRKMDHKDQILSKFTTGRTKAIKKRKNTLLLDYKLQRKSNKFHDRRIGENNRNMTAEDRIMARFVAQRVTSHRKSKYNLGDEDEVLTHQGRNLMEFEKFTNPVDDDSEDDDGKLDADFVKEAHFGGGLFTKVSEEKSHQSVIDKLIAESKMKKAERQQTKEETQNLTEKLDKDLQELFPLVSEFKRNNEEEPKPVSESYDMMVRELRFEPVGRPSDKLKSEGETQREERERLQKLENERLERMKRTLETEKDDEPPSKKHLSADDLDDGLDLDVFEDNSGDDDDDNDDDDEDNDDNDNDDEEEEDEKNEEHEKKTLPDESKITKKSNISVVPENLSSLKKMLGDHPTKKKIELIKDSIKLQKVHTGVSNVDHLMNFFEVLLKYVDEIFKSTIDEECWSFVSEIAPVLFELVQVSPDVAGQTIFNIIKAKQEKFSSNVKQGSSIDMLIFLKLVPIMFPTSDYHHSIATPSTVFLSHIISQNSCKNGQTVAMGLFSVTIMLEYIALSKRFSPEAINFLRCVLYIATPSTLESIPPVNSKNKLLTLTKTKLKNIPLENLQMKFSSLINENDLKNKTKLRLIFTSLKLLNAYLELYDSIPSAFVLWSPILKQLDKLPIEMYPSNFKDLVDILRNKINTLNRPLDLLMAARKRPKALRLYEPNIREIIDGQSFRTVSQKKLEREKLLHEYKKEMKGAMREIRKDRNFLARVKISEQAKQDAERRGKVKQIFSWGQNQQSELKRMERKNRFRH